MQVLFRLMRCLLSLMLPLLAVDVARACVVARILPPPVIWSNKPPLRVGIEIGGLFAPGAPTTCITGIGIGETGGPLLPSLDVVGAHLTITNLQTLQTTDVNSFVFQRDVGLDLPLAAGNTGPIVGQPLIAGATWFGFSALVQPFAPPPLAADEVFALWFDLSVSNQDYDLIKNLEVPGQFASGSADPLHPVGYFGAVNPRLVPEPSALLLAALALGALVGTRRVAV